jgi:hypothetical protein
VDLPHSGKVSADQISKNTKITKVYIDFRSLQDCGNLGLDVDMNIQSGI